MRILMLGNSLTTSHELPNQLAACLDAQVTVHARGGARLAEHLNPKTKNGARTQQALAEGTYDVVVLQEMSHGPATATEAYLRSATALCQLIKQSGATPVLYGTWAYAPTCPKLAKLGFTADEMQQRMHAAFAQASAETGAPLGDVGSAFFELQDATLYASDGVHPSEVGVQVAVRVLAEAIRAL